MYPMATERRPKDERRIVPKTPALDDIDNDDEAARQGRDLARKLLRDLDERLSRRKGLNQTLETDRDA